MCRVDILSGLSGPSGSPTFSWHDRSRRLMLVPLEFVVIMIPFMNATLRLSCAVVSFLVMDFSSSVGGLPYIVLIPLILMMIALALWTLSFLWNQRSVLGGLLSLRMNADLCVSPDFIMMHSHLVKPTMCYSVKTVCSGPCDR